MNRQAHPKLNTQIYQQACEWFVEFRAGEPDEPARAAFHAWLKESPAHMSAYLDVTATWNESGALELKERWPQADLIREAARDRDIIVAHPAVPASAPATVSETPMGSGRTRRQRVRWALAAGTAVLALMGVLLTWLNHDPTYATDIGEQRSIVLPDGSMVNLNSRSRLRIRYSPGERAIDLLAGQALFSVAQNVARPFIVSTDSATVRAVGTQFDVYSRKIDTTVTVIEGRVVTSAVADSAFVAAGQQVTVTPGVAMHPTVANVARATAWTRRELVFESTPLAQVAQEFNRYNRRQLVIRDSQLNAFEIDGIFSSTDPSSLVRFLRQRPDMKVIETDSEIVVTAR